MFKPKIKIKETRNSCNVRKLVNGSSSKVAIKYLPSHRQQREDKGLCTQRETKKLNILRAYAASLCHTHLQGCDLTHATT